MIDKNDDSKYNHPKKQKWLCSKCGHELATLLNDSAIQLTKEGREFIITFDSISTRCPECDSPQEKESPLLYFTMKETIKRAGREYMIDENSKLNIWNSDPIDTIISNIRIKAWGMNDAREFYRTFPEENVNLPSKERNRFLASLSENHKKIYKIICDTFSGFIDDSETIEAIKESLQLPSLEEAKFQYNIVLEKLREFKRKIIHK